MKKLDRYLIIIMIYNQNIFFGKNFIIISKL